ncbi:MAG: ATP-dependent Clp protease adapter ClpS [Gammaproteobacteria bacterium]|uniref:ATP-dependent Clp protease adapter protein ClpS n=1 Tax=OM182 bacterium TaxID=2510334 RepID=A0A520RYV1_9GAMM|nr:ATP-dependent Clp protease adapter ClpS [Gammaproteobacteria bacterium]RZO75377.1 MAG: ATP-dependent Clp protease adapter ClpS [OM182 bacterium]
MDINNDIFINMAENSENADPDRSSNVLELPAKPKLKKPPLYQVVLLNDDYTPMEFVIDVLQEFFAMNREKATQVMLAVHTVGRGTCGIFSRDIAETKSAQVNQYAQDNEHPLVSIIEAVD